MAAQKRKAPKLGAFLSNLFLSNGSAPHLSSFGEL
jgi:hypothetical protein